MAHKTIVRLIMLCLFLAACGAQGEVNTQDLVDSPEVTESPREEPLPVVDYDAVPMMDMAREQLSALRVQDLHGQHVVGVNSEGEIILIELATGQESTISSDGMAVEVVLEDEFIAWTRVEEPIESQSYHIFVHNRATGEQKRITEEPAPRYSLASSGTRLVWADKRNEMDANSYDTDIYAYDLATDTEYAIAVAPGSQQQPSIHGDLVVWQDNRNSEQRNTDLSGCGNCPDNRFDLYLYDFKDKDDKGKPIVEDKGNNSQPQIMGNRVVWQSYREDMRPDLYLLELDSGEIRRLTESPFSENDARLSEDRLLWTVKQDCDVVEMGADGQEIIKPTGVYLLDFKTDQVQKLTSYKEPFAWIDQNTVMISEACMAGWDVYTMTLESAELTQEAEPEAEASTGYQLVQSIASCRFSISYCTARMKHLLR